MDDLPREIKRAKPDVIVFTGALLDPQTLGLVRDQLWGGASVIGLADVVRPGRASSGCERSASPRRAQQAR